MVPFLLIFGLSSCAAVPIGKNDLKETVFLLHGMGRTRGSMALMGMRFRRAGYRTGDALDNGFSCGAGVRLFEAHGCRIA